MLSSCVQKLALIENCRGPGEALAQLWLVGMQGLSWSICAGVAEAFCLSRLVTRPPCSWSVLAHCLLAAECPCFLDLDFQLTSELPSGKKW